MVKVLHLFPISNQPYIKNGEQGNRSESNFHHLFKSLNENGQKQYDTEQLQVSFVHTLTNFLKLREELKKIETSKEEPNSIHSLSGEQYEMNIILQPLINDIHEEMNNHGFPDGIEGKHFIDKWYQSIEMNKSLDGLIEGKGMGAKNDSDLNGFIQASKLIERVLTYMNQFRRSKNDLTSNEWKMENFIDFRHTVERLLDEKHIQKLVNATLSGDFHDDEAKLEKESFSNLQNINFKSNLNRHDLDKISTRIKNVDPFIESFSMPLIQNGLIKGEGAAIGEWPLTLTSLKDNGANPSAINTQHEFVQKFLDMMKLNKHYKTHDGKYAMTIRLNPEHLGTLTVKLTVENNESVAKIIASTQSAKELLEHSIHQLKQALPNTEIEINRFELLEEQTMSLFREHQEEKPHDQKQEQKDQKQEEQTESFKEKLNEQLNFIV